MCEDVDEFGQIWMKMDEDQEMMVLGAHLLRVFLLGKVSLPFPDALTKLDDVRL